jgi:acetolactate synthase-1/2/3 large subunit
VANFFVNAGTDFAPLVEAYARFEGLNDAESPRPIVGGHENLVMGMAHGAYLMSGEPQAVMFHVNVGTANAVCGVLNAAAERVPLLVCAGRTPIYEGGALGARNTRVAWGQEMYDQPALVREAVKFEYELRGGPQLEDVVDRALTLMMTEPRGPAYLTLPREIIAEPAERCAAHAPLRALPVPTRAHPDPAAIGHLADKLAEARLPVISATASGADPSTPAMLAGICERFAIGYAEEQARYLNFPSDHDLHLGYSLAPVLRESDVLCFLESDVPWIPDLYAPPPETFIAQCGEDPNFSRYPMRTHRSDLTITAAASPFLAALNDALEVRRGTIDPQRRARIAASAARARGAAAEEAERELRAEGPIATAFLSATLAGLVHDRCVVFNEYSLNRAVLRLNKPSSYFYLPATGGLGWALPAALGAKLHAPERTMIVAIGDGTYFFSNPAACHHASRKHGLPVLTVICNNARWNAVDSTARMVYPSGHMTRLGSHELSDLRPAPAFEQYVAASDGYGVVVSERDQLAPALAQAMQAVETDKRQAVVNVLCR